MSNWIRTFCVIAALIMVVGTSTAALACPMCKIAHEDALDPSVAARPRAYMYSILFMLAMPATLVTTFGAAFYRLSKQQQAINAALLEEAGRKDRSSAADFVE